jgi:hypothetical protein
MKPVIETAPSTDLVVGTDSARRSANFALGNLGINNVAFFIGLSWFFGR